MEEKHDPKKYTIIKNVGQGAFGVVYKAKNNYLKKTVAIKKTLQNPKNNNREFEILVQLDHPNCIKVHNFFFTTEETPTKKRARKDSDSNSDSPAKKEPTESIYLHIVMDYYSESLYGFCRYYGKSNNAFPPALIMLYSYQMLRAVNYLKCISICHRDIKPQNIMIDSKTQNLVLCDFGSAKRIVEGEGSIAYICSRYYRAPELLLGQEEYGHKIDVWSVGCVIAEMFLGQPIFAGKSSQDQLFRIAGILGKPNKMDVDAMNPEYTGPLPSVEPISLAKLLKNANPLAIDLLTKILIYDPAKRMDPLQALLHPYFDQLRLNKLTINGRKIVDLFDFKDFELGGNLNLRNHLIPKWYKKKKG